MATFMLVSGLSEFADSKRGSWPAPVRTDWRIVESGPPEEVANAILVGAVAGGREACVLVAGVLVAVCAVGVGAALVRRVGKKNDRGEGVGNGVGKRCAKGDEGIKALNSAGCVSAFADEKDAGASRLSTVAKTFIKFKGLRCNIQPVPPSWLPISKTCPAGLVAMHCRSMAASSAFTTARCAWAASSTN